MSILYDVFARKEHPEPLLYLGAVEVEPAADLKTAILEKFGPEDGWLEMVVVPHGSVILVFSDKEGVNV